MTVAAPAITARIVAISEIHVPEPYDPLDVTAKANLAGLTVSIVTVGLHEPIRVRHDGSRYVLIDGAKRLRACEDAGVVQVPAQIETD